MIEKIKNIRYNNNKAFGDVAHPVERYVRNV